MCDTVKNYLDRRPVINHRRVKCCNSSRSLFCPECCALLVEPDNRPPPISLPCKLDIVLDEKNRAKSTGIHAKCLMNAQQGSEESANSCALFDLVRGDALPNYNESGGGTYILFPVPGESVPLASVARDINRLVVLDCKWTKSSCKDRPELRDLPKVHLTNPPEESYFWRWHNEGAFMVSTIEAIYYASLEVADHKGDMSKAAKENLIHLLYLFAEQRISIQRSCQISGESLPYGKKGKEEQRALRRYKGTAKQARDKEKGRHLRESARKEREGASNATGVSSLSQQVANINIKS